MKRQYTVETVSRGLVTRKDAGQVRSWFYDEPTKKFHVDVFDYGPFEGSLPATHGLVVGLRAGEVHAASGSDDEDQ